MHSVTLRSARNASRNNNFAGMTCISLQELVVFLLEYSNISLCNVSIKISGIQNARHGALTHRVDFRTIFPGTADRKSNRDAVGLNDIRLRYIRLSVILGLASL